ncbi:hypothetical protein BO82DRAFT_357739 [Aspergillus uvarum CBS 121591]|uniref:Uncharacterized protein n=1 Tax=Aspergillus uvarum CBS 121591 TaxID=1448315 RepID=A0A319C2E1_9EURO|nr:hypothetical protein BO82DRAFT_357739 [Aspergillus uvarum CBS 121591]PYH77959.1 hypothetical protein BO82DRAFT_357739 [Aspergillus uvarum CBS 121591]
MVQARLCIGSINPRAREVRVRNISNITHPCTPSRRYLNGRQYFSSYRANLPASTSYKKAVGRSTSLGGRD